MEGTGPGIPVDLQTMGEYRFPAVYIYTHALNECLHNHPEVNTREILRQSGVKFAFDLDRFWFCLTGIKKDIYWPVYGYTASEYLEIYSSLRQELIAETARRGWLGDIFMVMMEDEKQVAVLMSPGGQAGCGPEELAAALGGIMQRGYERLIFKGDDRYCNVTALSEALHGYEGIRQGYLQARALNDLSFFRMKPEVLTQMKVEQSRNGADYPTVMDACYQITGLVDEGAFEQAGKRLEHLFLYLLRGSYSISLCRDVLSYFKNMIQVRGTVYGILDGVNLGALCDVERYLKIEECVEALSPVLDALCAEVKAQGPRSRAVLQAMYYVKGHYSQDISLPDVARYVNVNANYLSGIFRENTGASFLDYITQTRVEEAKKRLAAGARVAETAAAVGFYDAKYFTRVFKRLTGMSPAQYREQKG